jgi:hypothetical protein
MEENYYYVLEEEKTEFKHFLDLVDEKLPFCNYKVIDEQHHFFVEKNLMLTPAGNPVIINNPCAELLMTDFIRWGTGHYRYPLSTITYLFSYLDFIRDKSEDNLRSKILLLLENDWMLQPSTDINLFMLRPKEYYNEQKPFYPEFRYWLSKLTKTQLGGVLLLHGIFNSIYLAFLLINGLRYVYNKEIVRHFKYAYWRQANLDYPNNYWKYRSMKAIFQAFRNWYAYFDQMR